MKKKLFTWGDIKKIINELPEQFLDKEVEWWGEEKGGNITSLDILEENYVRTDYGLEPASVQDELKDDEEPYPLSHPKGSPIFGIDV